MKSVLKKTFRIFSYCLLFTGILLMILLGVINLPFSHRILTDQANRILKAKGFPFSVDHISFYINGEIGLDNVKLITESNDTIVYAKTLEITFQILPLLRNRVKVEDLNLEGAVVFLESDSSGKLNLLSLFPAPKDASISKDTSGAEWEISIDNLVLKNIKFSYHDYRNAIFINQFIGSAQIEFEKFSFANEQIDIANLFIEQSTGSTSLGTSLIKSHSGDTPPAQWKFSADNIRFADLQYSINNLDNHQNIDVKLSMISLGVDKLFLATHELTVSQLKLSRPGILFHPGKNSEIIDTIQVASAGSKNGWKILCNSAEISSGSFSFIESSDSMYSEMKELLPLHSLNTAIKNIIFSSDKYCLDLDQLSFSLNDRIMMQSGRAEFVADSSLSGKLKSEFQVAMVTDNASLVTKGDTLKLIADLTGSLTKMNVDVLQILTASGVEFNAGGSLSVFENILESECDLNFHTNTISAHQTKKVLALFNIFPEIPNINSYSIQGNISNSLNIPDYKISVVSNSGNANLIGRFNIQKNYLKLNASLNKILLKEILGNDLPELISSEVSWDGRIGNLSELNGKGSVNVSEIYYKELYAKDLNIDFNIADNNAEFEIFSVDSALVCDLSGGYGWENNIYHGSLSGSFLYTKYSQSIIPDYYSVRSNIQASFYQSIEHIIAAVKVDSIQLEVNKNKSYVDSISIQFESRENNTSALIASDFLNAKFTSSASVNDFIESIQSIGFEKLLSVDSTNFMNASGIAAFPDFDFELTAKYDSIYGLFAPDSIFNFNSVVVNAAKKQDEKIVGIRIEADSIYYSGINGFGTKLNLIADDKQLSANLIIDSTRVNNVASGKSEVKVEILPSKVFGSLFIADSVGAPIYRLSAEALKSKEKVTFRTNSTDWIINSDHWTIANPEFLEWKVIENDFLAGLNMRNNQMSIDVTGRKSDSLICDLKNIQLSELFSKAVIPGLPDGMLNAHIALSETEKTNINFNLDVDHFKWKETYIENIEANGNLKADSSGIYEGLVLAAINDSSSIKLQLLPTGSPAGTSVSASFRKVPVKLIEPFTEEYLNELNGFASGQIIISEKSGRSNMNGDVELKSVEFNIVPLAAWFSIPEDKIEIKDNKITFDHFVVLDSSKKELFVDGSLNIDDTDKIIADLDVSLDDIRIMNTTEKDNPDFYGSIIVNSGLKITGPVVNPTIKGTISLEDGTNITYHQVDDISVEETQDVVTFASFSGDSTEIIIPLNQLRELSGMPVIQTTVEVDPKSKFNFKISSGYDIIVGITGSGLLNYSMLPNNSMSLTGRYEIKQGTAKLKFTGWPLKHFTITPGSYLRWDGDVADPAIYLEATSKVEGSYVNPVDGKTRNVDFIVSMKMSNQLSELDIAFTVKSPDQYISSVLNALPEDEQMRQAINLLIFESINLPNIESSSNYLDSQINSFWESQLNSLTKTNLKYVDLSFGVDTYTQTSAGGAEEEKTSFTYEMEKKFLKDRASVKISGRFNDDPQAGQQANTMVENFIFEYELDTMERKFLKLYTRKDYEDILDGEVTKSGVGFIYRKSYPDFRSIWTKKKKKVKNTQQSSLIEN